MSRATSGFIYLKIKARLTSHHLKKINNLIFSYLNIGLVINIESTHCNGAEFKNLVDNLI